MPPDLRSQGTWGSSGRGFRAPPTYLSPTYHLPIIYLSPTYHLPILYQSSITYQSSIYRSPIDHLSLPAPRLWRTMTSAELSRPEQEDEAGTASHVRVAPTAPPCASPHRCGRGGSFASPRRKRSAHLLRGSPLPPILTLHRLTETGREQRRDPPFPGAPRPRWRGGGAGVALRAGLTLLSDRQSDHRSPGPSSLGRPVSWARSASFPRRGFLSVSSRARQTKELLIGPFVSVDWGLGPVRRRANWP